MPAKRRVTAADVAEEAGVSTATVSYVLNNTPGQTISPKTAQRVRDAASRLGYVANSAARTLARGDSHLVIIDFSAFPRGEVADWGIQLLRDHLAELGYTSVLTWWSPQGWEEQLHRLAAEIAASRVLTAIPVSENTRAALRAAGVKTISSLVATPEELMLPLQLGTATQVEFLAEKGHESILFMPDPAPELTHLNLLRQSSGERTAASLGIAWHPIEGATTAEEYRANLGAALKRHPEATAIAAYNDTVALAALSALHTLGVRVPEEISVIGIDDLAFTPFTYPPLTTVKFGYDLTALTAEAVTKLLQGDGSQGPSMGVLDAVTAEVLQRGSA